jgi:hypothetical protein
MDQAYLIWGDEICIQNFGGQNVWNYVTWKSEEKIRK